MQFDTTIEKTIATSIGKNEADRYSRKQTKNKQTKLKDYQQISHLKTSLG